MNFTLLRFDSVESTNTEAAEQARRGADEGLAIVARQQTAGRGRRGRSWISPPGAGLYFSLVLRPPIEMRFLPLITLMAAVAACDTLETLYKIECDIKWVNDVHVRGKKICGILAETVETPRGLAIVLGIGINLKSSNFPPEIVDTATSIEAETGKVPETEILLPALTRNLAEYCALLYGARGDEKIRAAWAARSSYYNGKAVKVALDDKIIFGTTRGIEENGALRVETTDGEIHVIHAGDVENLRTI